jgi:hypothetical protein
VSEPIQGKLPGSFFVIIGLVLFTLGSVVGIYLEHWAAQQQQVDHGCGEWVMTSQQNPTVHFQWLSEAKEAK